MPPAEPINGFTDVTGCPNGEAGHLNVHEAESAKQLPPIRIGQSGGDGLRQASRCGVFWESVWALREDEPHWSGLEARMTG